MKDEKKIRTELERYQSLFDLASELQGISLTPSQRDCLEARINQLEWVLED